MKAGFTKNSNGIVGFDVIKQTGQNKYQRYHRSKIVKHKLRPLLGDLYDETLKQTELAMLAGYYLVPNCGHSVYTLKIN